MIQITFRLHRDYIEIEGISRMPSIQLLAVCPLQGQDVDVPPSAAVSTVLLCVTGSPREGIPFLAHGIQKSSSSSFPHLHNL
jgi:hypothetical protein